MGQPTGQWARIRHALWGAWWRKTLLIIVVLVGLYAALGFLLIPAVVAWQVPKQVAAHTAASARIGKVSFNPFTFDFRAHDFDMRSKAGRPLLSFKALDINFDLSTVVNRAWTFAWIRLDKPRVNVAVDKDGRLNFAQLLPPATAPPDKSGQKKLPAIRIAELMVVDGQVAYSDQAQSRDVQLRLKTVNFDLQHFSTQPDASGRYRLKATLGAGQVLAWHGSIGVNPLRSSGEVKVSGLKLAQFWPYVGKRFKVSLERGRLDVQADYTMAEAGKGLDLEIHKGQLGLKQLALIEASGGKPLVSVPELDIGGVRMSLAKRRLGIATVSTRGGRINATLDADHQLDLIRLLQPAPSADPGVAATPEGGAERVSAKATDGAKQQPSRGAPAEAHGSKDRIPESTPHAIAAADDEAAQPFALSVGEVKVQDYRLRLTDESGPKPVVFDVKPINLAVKGYSSDDKHPVKLTADLGLNGGHLSVQGELALSPMAAHVKLKLADLPLRPFQPYVRRFAGVKVKSGSVGVDGKLTYKAGNEGGAPDIRFDGQASLRGLHVDDSVENRPFVKLAALSVQGIHYASVPATLKIGTVTLDKPYARVIVKADHSTNIAAVLSAGNKGNGGSSAGKGNAAPTRPAAPLQVAVKRLVMKNGSMNFADQSLKPNVSVGIENLHGSVSHFSTRPGAVAKVDLEGNVNQYAPVTIKGTVQPIGKFFAADIGMQFKNLGLTAFSPYSGKFAGYRIKKGKANLTLHYTLDKGLLHGQNNVVLDQLELGQRVDSPDAVHLPLHLALALLKDSHGVIQLDLPVQGNLDDPQFAIGPLIWKVFVNVVKKVVTSPFHLLASLVSGSADQLDHVGFAAGRSELGTAQKASLTKLAQALQKRPTLQLEIGGVAVPSLDEPALADRQLLAGIRKYEGETTASGSTLTKQDGQRLLAIYRSTFHADATDRVQRKAQESDADYHHRVVQAARQRLVRHIKLSPEALQHLAGRRAEAVRHYLVSQNGVDPGRIFMLDPDVDAKPREGGVSLPLELRAN